MKDDTISRQAAINILRKHEKSLMQLYANKMTDKDSRERGIVDGISFAIEDLDVLPPTQPEPLTDKEQRIFLAAMDREEKVCKQVDEECRNCRELYDVSLVWICHEITRKVKGALWT